MIQFSEYADWAEVNRWAMRLFETPVALPEEAVQQVTRLRKLSSAEARIAAALRLGARGNTLLLGIPGRELTHRPYPPTQVLARRYGIARTRLTCWSPCYVNWVSRRSSLCVATGAEGAGKDVAGARCL